MADELTHKDPGGELTQAEFIASDGTGHVFESQATGDILYASSATVLSRLAKATDGNILELASNLPAWTASPTIGSTNWANANHAHAASNSGGTLTTLGTITTGVWNGTAIATAYIGADAITGAKIADDALDSEHYTDGSIDNAHIADDAIDSEHYAAGSIDTAHIADNQVTAAKLADIARGSIIYGNASAATAELTKGSANTVLTSDGTDIAWAAASAGALTRLSGDTSEATTTSTSVADINTVSSLTIAAASPFDYLVSFRKTSGAGSGGGAGLKLNSTILATPVVLGGGTANVCGGTKDQDEAQSSHAVANVPPTVTNYAYMSVIGHYMVITDGAIRQGPVQSYGGPGVRPTATITDFIVNAISTSSVTVGSDELHIYSRATS